MRTTTGGIVIPVTDLDALFTHAEVEGATITSEPRAKDYGQREYVNLPSPCPMRRGRDRARLRRLYPGLRPHVHKRPASPKDWHGQAERQLSSEPSPVQPSLSRFAGLTPADRVSGRKPGRAGDRARGDRPGSVEASPPWRSPLPSVPGRPGPHGPVVEPTLIATRDLGLCCSCGVIRVGTMTHDGDMRSAWRRDSTESSAKTRGPASCSLFPRLK